MLDVSGGVSSSDVPRGFPAQNVPFSMAHDAVVDCLSGLWPNPQETEVRPPMASRPYVTDECNRGGPEAGSILLAGVTVLPASPCALRQWSDTSEPWVGGWHRGRTGGQ